LSPKRLIWIRRISQGLFLAWFLFLMVESRLPQDAYIDYTGAMDDRQDIRLSYPVTFFFQINPLTWLTSLISGLRWIDGGWWAAGILGAALLLGRFFCGFICPFGTIHHMATVIKPRLKGRRIEEANRKTPSRRIKYFMLIAFLLSALFGLNATGWMDPISFLFRSLALAVLPGLGIGLKSLFDLMAQSDVKLLNLISYSAEYLVSPVFGYGYLSFQTGWVIGALFLLILFLNRIRPRFWCRSLCPLGALFGVCSRFSVLVLDKAPDRCTDCNRCARRCQGAASPKPDQQWEPAECLLCLNCYSSCPEDAVSFRFRWRPREVPAADIGRRTVLGSLLAGFSLPLLGRLDGHVHNVSHPSLIRPPGSMPEKEFLRLCQRCGLCMKVCPTNAINPTLTEAGLAGFWTPNLTMTRGYCEYSCTLCGSVCPTDAIRTVTFKEKMERPIRIGSAYVDRGRCLPWSGNGPCIVCEEVCPTSPKAIYLRKAVSKGPGGKSIEVQLPHVDLKRCVGCGICENKCPIKTKPAISVSAAGESRSPKNQILIGF
jgi:ferredoxin